MSGWKIYLHRKWPDGSKSEKLRSMFSSFRAHVKWKLMTRNDLVFWPLKYLIFEVCRWLSGADWNARISLSASATITRVAWRWSRATEQARTVRVKTIDWRSHPRGIRQMNASNENQKRHSSEGQNHRTFAHKRASAAHTKFVSSSGPAYGKNKTKRERNRENQSTGP